MHQEDVNLSSQETLKTLKFRHLFTSLHHTLLSLQWCATTYVSLSESRAVLIILPFQSNSPQQQLLYLLQRNEILVQIEYTLKRDN